MDSPMDRRRRGLKTLNEARPGERLAVVSVFERDRELLEYLDDLGIRPGVRLVVNAGGALNLGAAASIEVIPAAAAKIWVEPLPE